MSRVVTKLSASFVTLPAYRSTQHLEKCRWRAQRRIFIACRTKIGLKLKSAQICIEISLSARRKNSSISLKLPYMYINCTWSQWLYIELVKQCCAKAKKFVYMYHSIWTFVATAQWMYETFAAKLENWNSFFLLRNVIYN